MNACPSCAAAIVPGAMLCPSCCAPLPSHAVAHAAPVPIANVIAFPAVASSQSAAIATGLALVDNGSASTQRVIDLPRGDFSLVLGRHDLTSAPPVVVDVDLAAYCAPVHLANGTSGYPVSRRHATVTRTGAALTITPSATGTTFVRKPGAPDFESVQPGASFPLEPGTRVVLGTHRPLIVEVI